MVHCVISLFFFAGALATCPGTPECSGAGFCRQNNRCYCGQKRALADCSFDFITMEHSPSVLTLQWLGFVWYFCLLGTAAYCLWNIAKAKGLKWVLWDDLSNLSQMDPQQLPIIFCLLHSLMGTISFAYDPYYVRPNARVLATASLFQAEALALFCIFFSLVRFWVHLQVKFQHDHSSSRAMKAYDIVFVLFLIAEGIAWALWGVGSRYPATDPRNSKYIVNGTVFVCVVYLFYLFYLLAFGCYYGCKMREYLKQGNSGNINDAAKRTMVALRKITRLLVVLCIVAFMVVIVIAANTVGSLHPGENGSNAFWSAVSIYILLHVSFGIYVAVILMTLGQPAESNRHGSHKKALSRAARKHTHMSKKSIHENRHADLSSGSGLERPDSKGHESKGHDLESKGRESTKPLEGAGDHARQSIQNDQQRPSIQTDPHHIDHQASQGDQEDQQHSNQEEHLQTVEEQLQTVVAM